MRKGPSAEESLKLPRPLVDRLKTDVGSARLLAHRKALACPGTRYANLRTLCLMTPLWPSHIMHVFLWTRLKEVKDKAVKCAQLQYASFHSYPRDITPSKQYAVGA